MTVSLKHQFTSNVADSPDATLVQPSNWNAEHTLTAAANTLLGAITAGNVVEITCTSAGRDLLDDASASAQRTTLGLGTGDSPEFLSVNVGNASDTTITRSSAGIIAVEGVAVPLNSVTNTHIAQQIELGNVSDTTITRVSAGVIAVEGKNVALNGTGETLTTGTIELGAASDTTIARSSAGVISVEGGIVPKENRTNTFSANQIIEVTDNTNAALRVTQLGTGNAIVVEDSTNPDSTPFVVGSDGNVGIGASPSGGTSVLIVKPITGATSAYSVAINADVQADATVNGFGIRTFIGTANSVSTGTIRHYTAQQGTFGSGSSVTSQRGFEGNSSMIGATTNMAFYAANTAAVGTGKSAYAFYSDVNTATGGGTTYGLYCAGTADNYFNGKVGVNTNAPGANLHVSGTIRYTNRPAAGTITAIGYDANGDLKNSSSSLRYKHDIQDYDKGLDVVMGLRPVTFKFNGETRTNSGFIAEEIDAAGLPEVMLYDEEGRPDGVLYANMVALLTKALQEASAKIDSLESRIAALELK